MNSVRPRQSTSRRAQRRRRVQAASLDSTALEAIRLFVRALARCGGSPQAMTAAFAEACESIPRSLIETGRRVTREMVEAAHIFSLWFNDPLYLDRSGRPLPLSLRGDAPSIETLVRRVDSALDVQGVFKFLLKSNGLRKLGRRYVPMSRTLRLRGTGDAAYSSNLRNVLALLRTIERNTQPESQVTGSFEFVAENPHFPLRAREDFAARVRQAGLNLLGDMDSTMLSYERNRAYDEPTVRMGVGVYLFDDGGQSEPAENPRPPKRGFDRGKR